MSDSEIPQSNGSGSDGSMTPAPSPAQEVQPSAGNVTGPSDNPSPYPEEGPQPAPSPTPPPAFSSEPAPPAAPTPEPAPAPQEQPELMLPPGKANPARPRMGMPNPRMLLMLAVAAIVIVAAAFVVLSLTHGGATTSTTIATTVSSLTTTSVQQVNVANIDNCTKITRAGTYFLARNINTSIAQGACITVSASNVKLVGNGNSVTGSGPYSGVAPYSYGIFIDRASNVTVTGFRVLRFSYDVYFNGSSGSAAIGNNFTKPTISGVYLRNSVNNTVADNYVSQSDSVQGGVSLGVGSNGNRVLNNTIS